jgi:hypothetical protein
MEFINGNNRLSIALIMVLNVKPIVRDRGAKG